MRKISDGDPNAAVELGRLKVANNWAHVANNAVTCVLNSKPSDFDHSVFYGSNLVMETTDRLAHLKSYPLDEWEGGVADAVGWAIVEIERLRAANRALVMSERETGTESPSLEGDGAETLITPEMIDAGAQCLMEHPIHYPTEREYGIMARDVYLAMMEARHLCAYAEPE